MAEFPGERVPHAPGGWRRRLLFWTDWPRRLRVIFGFVALWALSFFSLIAYGLMRFPDAAARAHLTAWLDGLVAVGALAMAVFMAYLLWFDRRLAESQGGTRRAPLFSRIVVGAMALLFAWHAWDLAGKAIAPATVSAGNYAVREAADRASSAYCEPRPERCEDIHYVGTTRSNAVWLVEYRSDTHLFAVLVDDDLSTEVSTMPEARVRL